MQAQDDSTAMADYLADLLAKVQGNSKRPFPNGEFHPNLVSLARQGLEVNLVSLLEVSLPSALTADISRVRTPSGGSATVGGGLTVPSNMAKHEHRLWSLQVPPSFLLLRVGGGH